MDPNLMPPQQPQQQPIENPYDYILNAPTGKKKSALTGGGQKSKIILSVVFVVVVLLVLVIAVGLLRSLSKKNYTVYDDILKEQATILHISDGGLSKARLAATKNYISTVRSTITTDKANTTAFLSKQGQKKTDKQLAALVDTSSDKTLTAAEQTSAYDQKLTEILDGLLAEYQKSIKQASATATAKSEKALVVQLQTNTAIITNTTTK